MALHWYDENDEARDRARELGGNASWYWSPTWRAITSITDGVTTVHDVADAMARGDTSPQLERLIADYWLMVGHNVHAAAHDAADEGGHYPEPGADGAALLAAAEARASDIGLSVGQLAAASREAWSAESAARAADDARMAELAGRTDERTAEIRRVRDLLFDQHLYLSFSEGYGWRSEDSMQGQAWEAAEALVDSGRTAASITAARDAAARAYPQPAPDDGNGDTTLWAQLTAAPGEVQDEFWLVHPRPADPGISEAMLAGAYAAVGLAPATVPASDGRLPAGHAHTSGGAADGGAGSSAGKVLAGLTAGLDATAPDPYPGDAGPELAELLDDLDQARAQLEAGDVPAGWEHDHAEHIEHLEEQVAALQEALHGRDPGAAAAGGHDEVGPVCDYLTTHPSSRRPETDATPDEAQTLADLGYSAAALAELDAQWRVADQITGTHDVAGYGTAPYPGAPAPATDAGPGYPAPAPAAAGAAQPPGPARTTGALAGLGPVWREAAEISYTENVIDYGNDGRPEDDRALPAADAARRDAAIELIAQQTGLARGFILLELRDAAHAHGLAPGTDADPDHFAPPDWNDLRDRLAAHPEWFPQEHSVTDDPHDSTFHHGGGADLPPVPAQYTGHPGGNPSGPVPAVMPVLPSSPDQAVPATSAGQSTGPMLPAVPGVPAERDHDPAGSTGHPQAHHGQAPTDAPGLAAPSAGEDPGHARRAVAAAHDAVARASRGGVARAQHDQEQDQGGRWARQGPAGGLDATAAGHGDAAPGDDQRPPF